jgi:putative intracellular protease/amidase
MIVAKTIIKVLVVVTSHNQLGNTGQPTGYYLPEVSHPAFALEDKGISIDVMSPSGGEAPIDERSRDLSDPMNRAFLTRADLVAKIKNTLRPDQVKPSDYSAILFAGGHGTMWDFSENEKISKIARQIYENGGVISAVCHGPAALVNLKLSNGKYLVDGKRLTAFSNAEEEAAKLTQVMPFLLQTSLQNRGAIYASATLWQKNIVVDGRLVTGQNPASAAGVGEAVAKLLRKE